MECVKTQQCLKFSKFHVFVEAKIKEEQMRKQTEEQSKKPESSSSFDQAGKFSCCNQNSTRFYHTQRTFDINLDIT